MWAIRRVSHPLRNHGLCIRAFSTSLRDTSPPITQTRQGDGFVDFLEPTPYRSLSVKRFHRRKNHYSSLGHFLGRRDLSSQAGARGSGEDDGDDSDYGFSHDECESKDEASKNEIQLADSEIDFEENLPGRRKVAASMLKAMVGTQGFSVRVALDKWVEEGNKFGRGEIYLALSNLRRFGMYGRAVQFLEWLEMGNHMEFTEKDYSALLDSIAKLQGLFKAEQYIEKIPKQFRGELVYRTLLANCVQSNSSDKAEEVFNTMKDMGLPLSMFACNQLILLYKRTDKKKVADVLLLMENANLKPNLFTYKLLIDIKGTHNDITGIEALLETMESDGIKPDWKTNCIVARHYITAGLKEKARVVLKGMEGDDRSENRHVYGALLELYAELGDAEEVGRVWKECEESPSSGQFVMGVRAWGKLNEIEKAESVFESMLKVLERPNSLHYDSLLRVYADNKMLEKGRKHVQRMADNGIEIGPMVLDTLVKLYMEAGMIEKADEILHKATQQSHSRPILFRSYMAIMDRYADRGDIHNAEKMFRKMRESGYTARFNQFQALIRAYVVAEAPAYGMRERMKADKLFPNKFLAAQLAKLDSYEMKRNPPQDILV